LSLSGVIIRPSGPIIVETTELDAGKGGLAWLDGRARAHRSALGILVHIVATLLRTYYAPALALGTNATQAQLDEVLREEYGISGHQCS
jgi:hypothetical protein